MSSGRGRREALVVLGMGSLLTVALAFPIASNLGGVGRVDTADGQFSIWNVAWVARTVVVDPGHLFDANIFYPHRGTLAYSESNLGAGLLAVPVYWATRNPYAAHNFVVLLAFVLSFTGTWYLVRYLTGDARAAIISGICFAYCPFVFAHLAHIQLLMTAGIPFTMLAFHRLTDQPSPERGAALGAVMATQALCCGYYGVYVILLVSYAVLITATMRTLWASRAFWGALAVGAVVAVAIVAPAFIPYLELHETIASQRSLEPGSFSANLGDYLASPAYWHAWMLPYLPPWREVLFPGFTATILGSAGAWVGRRIRRGEVVLIYAGATALAIWASFGPAAGLYTVLQRIVPLFSLLRAPQRFGVIASFGLAVLTGVAVAGLIRDRRRANAVAAALTVAVVAGSYVVLQWPPALPLEPVYRILAAQPRGPIIEMPFYYPEVGLFQHTQYMLKSTTHWMPMMNGYSDYIPQDFLDNVRTLAPFPSRDAFKILEPRQVRYAVFHMYGYNAENRHDVLTRLKEFEPYLRPLYVDEMLRLYEITSFPP